MARRRPLSTLASRARRTEHDVEILCSSLSRKNRLHLYIEELTGSHRRVLRRGEDHEERQSQQLDEAF